MAGIHVLLAEAKCNNAVQDTLLGKQVFFITVCLALCCSTLQGQENDYRQIFGRDWLKAEEFLSENSSWIDSVLTSHSINSCEGKAVVFPELIRYSALRDKMETTLLRALYINKGKDYANFSVGRFQIKPSFAEYMSEISGRAGFGTVKGLIPQRNNFSTDHEFRAAIVRSLEDPRTELGYLVVFLKMCAKRYNTTSMADSERVKFISAAYNCGPKPTKEEVFKVAKMKFFTVKIAGGEKWSYSDIALSWYLDSGCRMAETKMNLKASAIR